MSFSTIPADSAFPLEPSLVSKSRASACYGLTKREYMVIHILAGLLANPGNNSYELQVNRAIATADLVITKLNEPPAQK